MVDAARVFGPEPAGLADLEWALHQHAAHAPRYALFRAYYNGQHRLAFATEKFKTAFGELFRAFALNLCSAVVDAPADRMQLTGWASTGAEDAAAGEGATLADRATAEWNRARMPSRIGTSFADAFRAGDAFLIPGRSQDGRWYLHPQPPEAMCVDYDDDDPERKTRAGKVWRRPDGHWRANVYRPDLITRWVSPEKSDDQPAPPGFRHMVRTPIGVRTRLGDETGPTAPSPIPGQVAVRHLPNNPGSGTLGRSQLVDAIPLQDALNKIVCDMLVASEFVALPQRAFIGVEDDIDPLTLRNRPLDVGAHRVIRVKDRGAQVTQFPQADLSGFLAIADAFRLDIARVTGTPPQYLQLGAFSQLAAAALRALETRFTRYVADRRVDWAPELAACDAWLLHLNGTAGLDVADRLEPQWAPVEAPAEQEDLTVAEGLVRLGASKAEGLRRMGYSDTKILAMRAEATTEPRALAVAAMAAFDRDEPVTGI